MPPLTDGSVVNIYQVAPVCVPCNTWFHGPTRLRFPNCISVGTAVFAQLTAESLRTLQWADIPPQIVPSRGISVSPSNTWSLGPTRVHTPNGILISSAVFAWLTLATPCVTICRIYVLRSTAMRPNHCCYNCLLNAVQVTSYIDSFIKLR